MINLRTARVLGLTVPQSLLARADEVIEWFHEAQSSTEPAAGYFKTIPGFRLIPLPSHCYAHIERLLDEARDRRKARA